MDVAIVGTLFGMVVAVLALIVAVSYLLVRVHDEMKATSELRRLVDLLNTSQHSILTRAQKYLRMKEIELDEKYREGEPKFERIEKEAEKLAVSVTIAASDVLAELRQFTNAAHEDGRGSTWYQPPTNADFDRIKAYALANPDIPTSLTTPHSLRECCNGNKPGCHAWVDLGELCESLWDSDSEQPD